MGNRKVVDKTIRPMTTTGTLTPGVVTAGTPYNRLGILPIGVYKGAPAFIDLDKLANQPLVLAEQLHIMGILDGREEDYDLQTLAVTLNEAIGTVHTGTLEVPSGEVWYVHAVESVIPASGGANIITTNWRCDLWTDRVAAAAAGQAFHGADVNLGVGGGTQWDEFGVIPLLWAATNKPQALRLPGGTILTVTFTNTVAVAAATVNCIFRIYGYIGRALVA